MREFPGGKKENGETSEQCLKRELYEEFGIDVIVGRHVDTSIRQYDFHTVQLMANLTKIITCKIKLNAHADVAWVEPENLGRYEFAPADIPFVERIWRCKIVHK